MRSRARAELHRHVSLAGTEVGAAALSDMATSEAASSGFSMLRLSVPARLLIVAAAAALLWSAVLWALH